jgi:hypothetical protein
VADFDGAAGAVVPDCARAAAAESMEAKINFFITLSFSFLFPKSVGLALRSPHESIMRPTPGLDDPASKRAITTSLGYSWRAFLHENLLV